VDELETENKRSAEEHSQQLKTLEQSAEEKRQQLVETHSLTVQDLTNRHQQDLSVAKQHTEDSLAQLQQVYATIVSFVKARVFSYFMSRNTHG